MSKNRMPGRNIYIKNNTVLVFTDNLEIIKLIEFIGAKLELNVHSTITYQDLIAVPCFLIIIDTDFFIALTQDAIESISEITAFENADELILIFTKPHKIIDSSFNKKQVKIPKVFDAKYLELTILNQYRKYNRFQKKQKDYEKIIARKMLLLLEGMKGNLIKKEECAKEFGVTERTIYRDLQFLNGMGQLFEYDKNRNAYKLVFSEYKDVFDKIE